MTREQYNEYKKNLVGTTYNFENQSLEEMLVEAEQAKSKGVLLPKEEVFAMLLSDER